MTRRPKLEEHTRETRRLLVDTRYLWDEHRRIAQEQRERMHRVGVNLYLLRKAGVSIGILCRELDVDPHSLYTPSMRDFVMMRL